MSLPLEKSNHIKCKQGAVRAVRFNVDGNYCITCGSDKTLKLWNPYTTVLLQTYSGHGYEVLDAQGSCDNAHIVSGGMDKVVFLWDVSTSNIIRKFRGHAGHINSVKFNEESTVVFSASVDQSVKAWDCRSKSRDPIQVMNEAKDTVTCLCVSDHEILTASLDCYIRRYDIRKGELCTDFLGSSCTSVTFTKDGQCILASCLNNTVKLLDKDTGEQLSEYEGHKNETYRVESCLTSSDAEVLSGSEDGFVYIWDLVEGSIKEKLKHEKHRIVHSLSSHPSKSSLLTAAEGDVYLWQSEKDPE